MDKIKRIFIYKKTLFIFLGIFVLILSFSFFKYISFNSNKSDEIVSGNIEELRKEENFSVGNKKGGIIVLPLITKEYKFNPGEYTGMSNTKDGVMILKVAVNVNVIKEILFISLPINFSSSLLGDFAKNIIQNQILEVSSPNSYYNIMVSSFNDAIADALNQAKAN